MTKEEEQAAMDQMLDQIRNMDLYDQPPPVFFYADNRWIRLDKPAVSQSR